MSFPSIAVVARASLFQGISQADLAELLHCLQPVQKSFPKNAYLLHPGEDIDRIGMVLDGRVHIIEDDFWGNRSILSDAGPSDIFGEAYACLPGERLQVGVLAAEPCTVLFFNVKRILSTCSSACCFHARLIENLLLETARKNLALTRKLSCMGRRTTRDKLLSYLSGQALMQGSGTFEIAFSRQQLADYLCVDRSAMSNELCKLRDEGLLSFRKNQFSLSRDAIDRETDGSGSLPQPEK